MLSDSSDLSDLSDLSDSSDYKGSILAPSPVGGDDDGGTRKDEQQGEQQPDVAVVEMGGVSHDEHQTAQGEPSTTCCDRGEETPE